MAAYMLSGLRADSEADCEYPPDCEFYKTVSARSTISGIVATASIVDRGKHFRRVGIVLFVADCHHCAGSGGRAGRGNQCRHCHILRQRNDFQNENHDNRISTSFRKQEKYTRSLVHIFRMSVCATEKPATIMARGVFISAT